MYDWVKALHVVAVVVWVFGMICLPWLFVYHCGAPVGSAASETFKAIERRLLKTVINPTMIVAWIAGPCLAWLGHWWTSPWFMIKFVLGFALSGAHGVFSRWVKDFGVNHARRNPSVYRVVSALPVATLAAVVVLVVVKPF
jgi:protoporphyrinogen IX oxidase